MSYWEERQDGWMNKPGDSRSPYDTDYARIIHSASFRRLQGKTQILSLGDSDFYRTRLTHSLEVAQIAYGLVLQLQENFKKHQAAKILPTQNLIQSISLTHDLGHPPFGHGGEIALNYCMRFHGGFEGNAQTLRILTRLEKFSENSGSNLTRRTLLGILKYPAKYSDVKNSSLSPDLCSSTSTIKILNSESSKPPKCYFDSENQIVDWILEKISIEDSSRFREIKQLQGKHGKPLYKSLDCSIMDIADDIAYGVHDLEDAIALNLVSKTQFMADIPATKISVYLEQLKTKYPDEFLDDPYNNFIDKIFSNSKVRKRQIGRLVNYFITNIQINEENLFEEPLLKYRVGLKKDCKEFLDVLQGFVVKRVIKSPGVQHLEFKGQQMVVSVFEALASEPKRLLPEETYELYESSEGDKDAQRRVICDHVSGMTDGFLLKTYDRLFSPRMGSIFDRL